MAKAQRSARQSPNVMTLGILKRCKLAAIDLVSECRPGGPLQDWSARIEVLGSAQRVIRSIEQLDWEIREVLKPGDPQ